MKTNVFRKLSLCLAGVLVAGACLFAAASHAADWPTRPVELIVPFRAGGDTDFHARTYAKYLEKEFGRPVTIINMEGAGGGIAMQHLATSRPDGYKLVFNQDGNLFTSKIQGTSELDHNNFDLAAIGVRDDTNVLVAGKDAGFANAQDFLTKVRAEPGKYSVATNISGFSYFVVCKLEAAGGFKLNPVDYGGAAAMIPAILGNKIPLAVSNYGVFKQHIDNGDIIPLMVCGEKRNPNFPDVPTVIELGLPDAASARAYFFAFTKGTDPAIINTFSAAIAKVQKNPTYAEDIRKTYYLEPFYLDAAAAKKYMDEVWVDMVKYREQMQKN
jgi:tripartite-type tricarboxylate transporter receptor subunit TctC